MLKNKLRDGHLVLGSWITLGNTAIAELIAKAGYDWIAVDLEHSSISIDVAADLIRIIDLCGVSPLVRLTSNDPNQVKRVMDSGAHGIIVPSVNSASDAKLAVSATRYFPEGFRGVGLGRAQGYGANFKKYFDWQKDGPVVIVMIEHKDALLELEEILSVPGVDAYFIGPYDLSCSLGIPGQFDDPIFIEALTLIKKVGERVGCPAGIHIVEPDLLQLRKSVVDGYKFIAYGVDIRILDIGVRSAVLQEKRF